MMTKRTLLAFSLSLLVIMGYNYYLAQKYPPQPTPANAPQQQEVSSVAASLTPPAPENPAFAQAAQEGQDILVETDLVKLLLTSSGARIKSCQMKLYPEERLAVAAIQKQIATIEQSLASASAEAKDFLQREKDKLQLLLHKAEENLAMAELVSLAATLEGDLSLAIILPGKEKESATINTTAYQYDRDSLSLNPAQPEGEIKFSYQDALGRQIIKRYSFSNSNYGIGLELNFLGWDKPDLPEGYFLLFSGPDIGMLQAKTGKRPTIYAGPVTYLQSGPQGWVAKERYTPQEQVQFIHRQHQEGKIIWTGLENRYFLTAILPAEAPQAAIVEKNKFGEQKVGLKVPWQGQGPYKFRLYLGPKKEKRLAEIDATLVKTIDYGLWSPIARLIYQILVFFSHWTHNFGWAIVLLCLLTKIVFSPLTHHSFVAMQKMQEQTKSLQPEMKALQEKFRDDPQKLNRETMALYRRKGINPLASCQSGCLPLLLQMPVFFALYAVLYNSIELRGEPFLGWIKDLSAQDPYYILPILMGLSMFAQQKLTGMGPTSSAQQEQAKMMTVLMPIFLTWVFASLPSGVVLYWLTSNVLTAGEQLFIQKKQSRAISG